MGRSLLIVDDVEFVRKTIAEIARGAHFEVVGEAKNGLEAIELYIKHRPDIVTMDVVMPEMSGIEATRRIVKRDKSANIVIVSALGQEHLVMEAIYAGAKDYVTKPFTPEDLLKSLEHIVSGETPTKAQALR